MSKDYYTVLGVAHNATKDEIKKAYRKLAHQHHPDKKGGDEARFKELSEAYQILSDDQKRAQYDRFGRVFDGAGGSRPGGFEWPGGGFRMDFGEDHDGQHSDFSDVFEDFMGNIFGGGRGRSKTNERKGKDIHVDIEVTFTESIFGVKKDIELAKLMRCVRCNGLGGEPGTMLHKCGTCQGAGNVKRTHQTILGALTQVSICAACAGTGQVPETPCSQCRGRRIEQAIERIEVFIPKGMNEGEVLKITGKGEASLAGGIPGDLFIHPYVQPQEMFRRQGDDIVMILSVKLSQAILGDTISAKTLDGGIDLKIPEGTQTGDVLRLRGKGAFASSGYGRGNLLIEMKVEMPRKVSRAVKTIIYELKKEGL
ncbi:MAG: molecular chaperone DnaJ [Patescibacteria group bacterium]